MKEQRDWCAELRLNYNINIDEEKETINKYINSQIDKMPIFRYCPKCGAEAVLKHHPGTHELFMECPKCENVWHIIYHNIIKASSLKPLVFNRARIVFNSYNSDLVSKAKAARQLEKLLEQYKRTE